MKRPEPKLKSAIAIYLSCLFAIICAQSSQAQSPEDDDSKMARPTLHAPARMFVFEFFPASKSLKTYVLGHRIRLLEPGNDLRFYVTPSPVEEEPEK